MEVTIRPTVVKHFFDILILLRQTQRKIVWSAGLDKNIVAIILNPSQIIGDLKSTQKPYMLFGRLTPLASTMFIALSWRPIGFSECD